jgi:hypothetical protein
VNKLDFIIMRYRYDMEKEDSLEKKRKEAGGGKT